MTLYKSCYLPVMICLLTAFCLTTAAQDADTDSTVNSVLTDTLLTDTLLPEGPEYHLNLDYIKSFWPSIKYTATRPMHWDKKDWTKFTVAVAGIGSLLMADWEIRNFMQHNQGNLSGEVTKVIEPFGNFYGAYLFPTMYVAGALTGQSKIESAGLVGAKSLAISTLFYTASKTIIRRKRPDEASSSFDYAAPFTGYRYTSSPSGHSNTIFTVATALALEFQDSKWVPPLVYTLATATAVSRIYQNRHWASDVLMGSLMGHFITKAVWKSSQKQPPRKLTTL